MGFFGDLIGSFTGSKQAHDLSTSNAQATTALRTGYGDATGALGQGRTDVTGYANQARGRYAGQAQAGGQAQGLYNSAIGVNGADAQQQFGQNYAASDPFRQQNQDMTVNALNRFYAARGLSNSGVAQAATARALTQQGSSDYQNYLTRLQGAGQQGYAANAAQAGIDQQTGQQMAGINEARAGLATNYADTSAGNAINYGNALAGSRNILWNNILGVAGVAAKAAAGPAGAGAKAAAGAAGAGAAGAGAAGAAR